MHARLLCPLLFFSCSGPQQQATAPAPEPPPAAESMAVLRLTGPDLASQDMRALDNLLSVAASKLGPYKVVTPGDIEAQIGFERLKDAVGCANCMSNIGDIVGAKYLLSGEVVRLAQDLLITLSVIDLQEQTAVARGKAQIESNAAYFPEGIDRAVRDLFGAAPKPGGYVPPETTSDAMAGIGVCREGPEKCLIQCQLGRGRHCHDLALMYFDGRGVDPDLQQAMDLFENACESDYYEGCNAAGDVYFTGQRGVNKDHFEAKKLYENACSGGSGKGCDQLGTIYASGSSVEQSNAKAATYYRKACDVGYAPGCQHLEQIK